MRTIDLSGKNALVLGVANQRSLAWGIAEALGLEIVYDGEGAVVPGADQTPVITELVNAQPDIVWATTNPTTLAEILGGAYAQGLTEAQWSGNSPTWNYQLLATDLGPTRCTPTRPIRPCGAPSTRRA